MVQGKCLGNHIDPNYDYVKNFKVFTGKLVAKVCDVTSVNIIYLSGLCIPANNTLFIVGISEKLAAREPQLTLEVREG